MNGWGPATLVHLQVVKGWGGGGLNPGPFASREGLGGGLNPCPFASREGLGGRPQVVKGCGAPNPCPWASREGLGGAPNPCPFGGRPLSHEGLGGPQPLSICKS